MLDHILFERFSKSFGPSGHEEAVVQSFIEEAAAYIDNYVVDDLGNLYCYMSGDINHTLALTAHADQIGFMINHIEDCGMVRISSIGTLDVPGLQGTPVIIKHGDTEIKGIIAAKPSYYFQSSQPTEISDLWVDIGADCINTAKSIVSVGDYVVFSPQLLYMGNDLISCTAADNRCGVYILLETLRSIYGIRPRKNLFFILSVQEELGARGAFSLPFQCKAEEFIVVDVTHATDCPSINAAKYGDIRLGQGFVIPRGSNLSHTIQDRLIEISSAAALPYQLEAKPTSSGTDAKNIQISNGGMKTGLISIPCRYMHSPVETVSSKDIVAAISLLKQYCTFTQ